jgi:hypothetical protein
MKRSALIALLCVFVAFTASDIVSRAIFERLPHLEDEFAYLYQARLFARGDAYIETPAPVRAYWQPFLINLEGKRFGKYTPGWPLILAAGVEIGELWVINAWLSMLTVAVVYRLGREVYNPQTGAVAALLTAISPAAMLLSGSLMAHTLALFLTTLFLYALWRIERGRRVLLWAAIGGAALGLNVLARPMTAIAIAVPFVIYSVGRVGWRFVRRSPREGWRTLRPLLVLGVIASAISLYWPVFNYTVTARPGESFPHYLVRFARGDEDTNLYLYIWDYDKIGFGEGHGRVKGGHTLEIGWRHAKKDLNCASRDLLGWGRAAPDQVDIVKNPCAENGRGYSWVVIVAGLLLTLRKRWTWLFLALIVSLIAFYLAYWIGGNLYSARYYSEALTAATLLAAAGIAGLAHWLEAGLRRINAPGARAGRRIVYGALAVLAVYTLAIYAPARLRPLTGYGRISQGQIEQVNRLRQDPDRPVVVIVWGEHHWRDIGALMAVTDPYLDSEIVLARDPDQRYLDTLRARWSDREQLFFFDGRLSRTPPETVATAE